MGALDEPGTPRSIAGRIRAVSAIILVLFTAALIAGSTQLSSARAKTRVADAAQANAADALELDARLQLARALIAEFALDRDPLDVEQFWVTQRSAAGYNRRLARELVNDRSLQKAFARQRALNAAVAALAEHFFEVVGSGDTARAHALALRVEANIEAQALETATIRSTARAHARAALVAARERFDRVRAILLALAFAVLAVGVLLAVLLAKTVSRSFGQVSESEERFRTLVANIPGAVYRRAADSDWSMGFVSDRIEEIAGRPAADFTSGRTPYSSVADAAQRDSIADAIAGADDDGAFTLDYALTHADGSTRWVRDKGQVIRGADGAIQWLDGTISDISDVKRLEDEREGIESELRIAHRLEVVGQLAAGIAHEINTPIQFIGDSVRFLGQAFDDLQPTIAAYQALRTAVDEHPQDVQALAARAGEAEEDADLAYLSERVPVAVERTRDGVRRIGEIVGAMREFGRVGPVAHAPADINDALCSTLIVARNEYKYVANVVTDYGDLPHVSCNVGELSQVFLNLIVNAAHAIESASVTGVRALGTITIRTRFDDGAAVVAISDTGTGISVETQARIFDPFFTTKEVGKGTGQGLAISRSIVVDKHNGTLTVDSEVGVGTTFVIRLPIG
jgi:PAS domain S-box-containing protein